jgi:two-component system sensor histidine kinase RegB
MKNISQNTNQKNLLQLLRLRLIAIFGQVATILFVSRFLEIELPLSQMFGVIALLAFLNCLSFYRYKLQKNISDKSLFIELLFDVAALTAQLYLSGGISNPFISLFLLQVVISAILLRPLYAWVIAAITTACYLWLNFNFHELHAFHHHGGSEGEENLFNLHLHGMLISYVSAAILLVIFITRISENMRERDRKSAEEQQLIRLALLTTAAAHDLGTPLTTISVVLNDWKNLDLASDLRQDIELVESQLERCKKAVSDILFASKSERVEEAGIDILTKK